MLPLHVLPSSSDPKALQWERSSDPKAVQWERGWGRHGARCTTHIVHDRCDQSATTREEIAIAILPARAMATTIDSTLRVAVILRRRRQHRHPRSRSPRHQGARKLPCGPSTSAARTQGLACCSAGVVSARGHAHLVLRRSKNRCCNCCHCCYSSCTWQVATQLAKVQGNGKGKGNGNGTGCGGSGSKACGGAGAGS